MSATPSQVTAPKFSVPPGYYPPFAVVTDDDHTGWIIIATALGLAMVLLSTLIRIVIRSLFGQRYGIDDLILGIATVLAVVQEIIIFNAAAKGLGKSVDLVSPDNIAAIEKLYYASGLLSVIVLGLVQASVLVFIRRLTPFKRHQTIVWCIMGASVVWTILAFFLFALECDLSEPWVMMGAKCSGLFARRIVVFALEAALELAIFSSIVLLVSDVQTSFSNKVMVLVAFSLRLPIVVPIAFRLATYNAHAINTNFTFAENIYVIWGETQLNYSIISATIPILRPFINSLSTNYGMGLATATEYSGSRTRGQTDTSIHLSTFRSFASSTRGKFSSKTGTSSLGSKLYSITSDRGDEEEAMPSQHGGHDPEGTAERRGQTTVVAGAHANRSQPIPKADRDTNSVGSTESQRMIIRKSMSWTVQRGDGPSATS